MRKFALTASSIVFFSFFVFQAGPALAQATRTWVSGVGDDANPCSRTAPCKTFAGAISKTIAGGEINCIDPGGFGALTITKSIMIDCAFTEGGVLAAGTNGIVVSAGTGDIITLRGLDIFGSNSGINGVVFNTGGALIIEKSTIREFQSAGAANGFGVLFRPTAASKLYVTDTKITSNGSGSTGGAIMIRPTGSGSARAWANRVEASNNVSGITTDGGSTTGLAALMVRDSVSVGATSAGFAALTPATGGGTTFLFVERSSSFSNVTGINSVGARSNVVINGSTIIGNTTTGLSSSGGGQIFSYTNNSVFGNGTDGNTTGTVQPK